MVSLGTGEHTKPILYDDARRWGLVEWVRPIIDIVFDGVADTVHYQLGQLLAEGDYLRVQAMLDRASDALDDASARNLKLLEEQADDLVQTRRDDIARMVEALTAAG
jgi:hypothetical protein